MRGVTIKDIAKAAGVSVTTVSRVINQKPDVNPETRKRVEEMMATHRFVVNDYARSLKQLERDMVAVILRGHRNAFFNALSEAILDRAGDTNAHYLLTYIDERADEFQEAIRLITQKRVGGVIFVGSRIDDRSRQLADVTCPMVFATVNAENSCLPHVSSVSIDDRKMGQQVAEALLERGHRKIAVFGGSPVEGDSLSQRYQGVLDAYLNHGLHYDPSRYVETRFSYHGAYDAARALFTSKPDTTAAFAMSDIVAMGVIRALQDLGKKVPQDVSVIGFDGIEATGFYTPRIATVEQPVEQIADAAVQVLANMMAKRTRPHHVTVQANLVLRESLGAPPK